MAANELEFQRELIDLIEHFGGHAFKASNRFLVGVHDVHYTIPGLGSGFIECKYEKDIPDLGVDIRVNLTKMQQKFARDEARAGGVTFGAVYGRGRGRNPTRVIRFFDPLRGVAHAPGGLAYAASTKWYRSKDIFEILELWHDQQRHDAAFRRAS